MKLRIADDLALPLSAATQTFLVVGKRGSGKSSTATTLAEQLISAGISIAAIDPVDVWWGLKAGASGTREGGLDVYVFGGRHADLPLEPTAGVLLADVLVEHRINAIMVIREFSNREKARFIAEFAERLFQKNREVLHIFCEEAHETMPQNPYRGEEEMLGRMNRLWKLGRTSGIGMTAVTQRPASLNKNVTTQAEVLISHRLLAEQDIDAIDGWIKHHRQQDLRQQVLSTLAELKTGEAWFWAPDFPEDRPVGLRRVRVLLPATFDSRKTPEPGEKRKEPRSLARVDLEKIRSKMSATIEKAKRDDPATLRGEIARLQRQVRAAPVQLRPIEKIVRVPSITEAQARALEKVVTRLEKVVVSLRGASLVHALEVPPTPGRITIIKKPAIQTLPSVDGDLKMTRALGKGEQKVLCAVAQYGDTGVTREAVTVLTGYKRSSRDTYLQRLLQAGYVRQDGRRLYVTSEGVHDSRVNFEALPTGSDLRDYWLKHLPEGEKKILAVLVGAFPQMVERDMISEATGYKRSSRDTYLQRLRARELVAAEGTRVRAAGDLFS